MAGKKKGAVKFDPDTVSKFYPTLKSRVDQYFKTNNLSVKADTGMVIKSFIMLAAYFGPLAIISFVQPSFGISLLLWFIMGVAFAGIGMNIMHDALHGSYSKHENVNYMAGTILNFIGGSIMNWKLQHNILHHTYTNVYKMDEDIDEKLILRFTEHSPGKKVHKFQWWYAFFFYGITTLYWVFLKDFLQYNRYKKNGVNNQSAAKNRIAFSKLLFMKIVYVLTFLVLPLACGVPWWSVMCGFLLMHVTGGIILTLIFQLAHTVEGTTHPIPDESGKINQDWAIHQMESTMNFAPGNKVLSWYVGGLNYQVEHHLFPRISHIHYPGIAPIVKSTAEEFGVPYNCNPTFFSALKSHVRLLKQLGRIPDLDDAIG